MKKYYNKKYRVNEWKRRIVKLVAIVLVREVYLAIPATTNDLLGLMW